MTNVPPKMLEKIEENEALIRQELGDEFYVRVTTVAARMQDIQAIRAVLKNAE